MSENPTSLDFVQGDTFNLYVTWTADGSPSNVDLTGSTITADVRKEYNTSVIASFTVDPTDLATGQFTLSLSAAETAALPNRRNARITSFVFDINVEYANGDEATPVYGYLKMQPQVTR